MIRVITTVTLASGGIAAAASLAIGVAAAEPDATTISVPDPFGVTFFGTPDILYQTGNASEDIAYGHQLLDLNSDSFGQPVEQFFLNNVTVNGEPLNLTTNPLSANDVPADIIDKLESNGHAEQQILFGPIANTNIESGVIGIHYLGDGYGYEYIDLVGPGTTSLNSNGVDNAVGAFLLTPTGTYDVSHWENGGDYGGQAYLESQEFDLSHPLSDPFGSLASSPDITYQTGDVFGNTAYGSQTFDFNTNDLPAFAQQFFSSNDVSTAALTAPVHANVIDTVSYNGLFDGLKEQQILLPSIAGTDIKDGVIDIQNLGNGYSLDYIDLVGPGTSHLGSNGVNDAIGEWLVTPTAVYDMTPWAGLEAQMFDPTNFEPGMFFPDAGLIPPDGFLF